MIIDLEAEHKAVLDMLDEWDQAYSTDIFGEVSNEEIEKYGGLISRNSAAMGRFMVGVLRRKIKEAAERKVNQMNEKLTRAEQRPTWIISGIVDQVNVIQGTITLWLDGFDKLHTVPITPAMPGWLLQPEAAFRTKIPYSCEEQRDLQDVIWEEFTPQEYTHLSDDELFAQLTAIFYPPEDPPCSHPHDYLQNEEQA